ncbi:MAG TPA: prolyl oligopeptidase family serine peptidase [Bryobacteraceae bacterium]|nr:prolyl oligopeptidase family serine peptidase [Bryobacteraceae bacterium]
MRTLRWILVLAVYACAQPAPKPLPPPGIQVPAADRAELEAGLERIHAAIAELGNQPLVPDVEIYEKAVRYALQYHEFFKPDEVAKAKALLREGQERAAQLAEKQAPWTTATGLVVRGYLSKIDGSVQPYGLVVPPSYSPTAPHRWRLDLWFHGRSDTLSEINFITDRERNPGEFQPRDTIVLHLYGRYCNASKFAGEVDAFEALDAVKRHYPIDENRILVRGFSMGGASAWHIGAHFAGLWAAVAPGAGFAETAQYQHLKLTGQGAPPWWEQTLWHLYDARDYAANLFNTATIEYHGEIDPQKQAGDVMERAMAEEGLRLIRLEGPNTPHRYHPQSKVQLENMLDAIAARGADPYPRKVLFTTWTLAYNRMKWVTVDALAKHWERARVEAEITGDSAVAVTTSNVTALTLQMGPGGCPLDLSHSVAVRIDGQPLTAPTPGSDHSWTAHFRKSGARWQTAETATAPGLHKRHGLQGPIDDAFLDSFIFVTPTGTPLAAAPAAWADSEEKRAIAQWRAQFRGDARVVDDTGLTDAEIASSNLVLWGDPASNHVLARILGRLPIQWTRAGLVAGSHTYSAETHVPILIYPNPLNPAKYVVVNSGFTFREDANATNSRQTPRLPDYAVVDVTTPPDSHFPGKIVLAGFFNEEWGW